MSIDEKALIAKSAKVPLGLGPKGGVPARILCGGRRPLDAEAKLK